MPEFHIRDQFGKSPKDVFSRVGFSGDHSRTIALVQSGAYQVGAVNFKVWENEKKAGKIDPAKVSIIWKTPPYPDYQWTIRGDLEGRYGAGFSDKVKAALLIFVSRFAEAAEAAREAIEAGPADPLSRALLAVSRLPLTA